MSTWVTPTIMVGEEPSATNVQPTPCETPEQAREVILGGGSAWFATDDWDDLVRETLLAMQTRRTWVERQIHAARTGVLLDEKDFQVS